MWLGIDFGTSNSCASLVMNNTIKQVADPTSKNYVFPSSVYLDPEKGGRVLVGQSAENKRFEDVRYYQRAFKLLLGQKEPFMLGQYKRYPVELVSEVIKKLKSEAEQQITHHSLTSAIITIPARYEQPLRELMRQAAQGAGFQRIEILEEPVAAAVYHASRAKDRVKDGEIFLVYDLGGGTFDATLVRRKGLRYELLGAPDGRQVGGEDFDNCIYADVLAKLPSAMREKFAQPHYRAARMQMLHICRDIKHALSISLEINKSLTLTGQVVNYHLSRKQFVSMIEENIEETITCCEGLLKRAKIASRDVRCVLLVGGSCRIPYIRERLKQRLNIDVFPIDEPELAVSMGAAFYGDALDRATAFVQKVDGLGTSAQFRNMLYQHLPELFHMLAHPLAYGIAQEAVKPALRSWQQGWTTKLNDIQQGIEHRTKQWITSDTCKEAIRKISLTWVQQRIPEIARLSDPICDAYGVSRNILRLPTTIPALEAGLPGVPVNEGAMVNLNAISGLVTAIVAIVMGIIIVHLHLAGPVGIIAAAATYYFGRGKTEQWIREANLPQWFRKLVLSDDKIESQVSNAQSTLATALFTELEKNRVNFDQFVAEIQRILQETMHEQATREARFIWLHTNEEQAQAA